MSSLVNHLRDKNPQNMFLALAYGRHVAEGYLCASLKTDGDPFDLFVRHKLGKREWNACKALWWRGFSIPSDDYVFHPGKLSTGNDDPIQGVDSIFDMDIPHSLQPWLRAKLPQSEIQDIDPKSTPPEGLYGIFECLKIYDYDSTGAITDFSYSANPARVVADLFLIEGRRNKDRMDWGAWAEWRDFLDIQKLCDYSQIPKFIGFGLTSEYFNGQAFDTLVEKRIDAVVEFLQSSGAPAYGLDADNFSARHEGKIKPKFTEEYTFYLTANDGGKLWIDGDLIIDQWSTAGEHSAAVELEADEFYDIKVEWHNGSGDSEVRLEWESSTQPREVVPTDRLYPKPENKPNYEAHIAFTKPTRLDDAIRQVLALCNSTYQRVNGKYRFFCHEQLNNSSFNFDENENFYPDSVEIEPLDLSQVRNVWQATCRDLDSQYLEQLANPLSIELNTLISLANRRNEGDLLDFQNMNRWQAYRLLEHRAKRATALNSIKFRGNCETYPVLKGDRVKLNLEFLNLENYECRVSKSVDKSSQETADDREFILKEWSPSSELVPELVTDETPPTVPENLTATVISSNRIDLNYDAATDDFGVAGYEIRIDEGSAIDVGLTLNTSRTGLIHSTTYAFEVRAYDAAGNRSDWSDPVEATTPYSTDSEAPTIPGSLTATPVSTSQINLAWNASTDNIAVTGYEIEVDGTVIDVGLNLFSNRTGFAANSEHTFRVRAYDAAGNRSGWSALKTVSTLADTAPPNTPSWVYAYWTGGTKEIYWEAISNAIGYELRTNGAITNEGNVTNVSQPYVGGLYFEYYVRAYNANGYSGWSPIFGLLIY